MLTEEMLSGQDEAPLPDMGDDILEVPCPKLWFPKPLFTSSAQAYEPPRYAPQRAQFCDLREAPAQLFLTARNTRMKMLDMTPANLDPELMAHLKFLMQVPPEDMVGALRPGCVLLSVDTWFKDAADAAAAEAALVDGLAGGGGIKIWGQGDAVLYSHTSQLKMRGAGLVGADPRQGPTILSATPAVCNPGVEDWRIVVSKSSYALSSRSFVCRVHGRFHDAAVVEEEELPDGSICYTLRPPMEDAALGLAWVEVVDCLARVREEYVSHPYPMFLTTRCDVCGEISSLFSEASPQQSRDMAGVLKALEGVLHPYDRAAVLPPDEAAAIALLCARHGFHQTLEEIIDEVVFRGPPGALATMTEAAERAILGGLLACAASSRCPETQSLVAEELIGVDVGDPQSYDSRPIASTRMAAPDEDACSEDMHSDEVTCPPEELVEPEAIRLLRHPLAGATTLAVAALVFSMVPWTATWQVAHVLYLAAFLHLGVPALYWFAYAPVAKMAVALASSQGVALPARGCVPLELGAHRQYQGDVASSLKGAESRIMFGLWLVWATVGGPLDSYMKVGTTNYTVAGFVFLVCCHLIIAATREIAVRKQSLLLWAQRMQAAPLALCNLYWGANAVHAWAIGIPPYSAPSCLLTQGPLGPMLSMLVVKIVFYAVLGQGLVPPVQELWAWACFVAAASLIGGCFLSIQQAKHYPEAVPHQWISWAILELTATSVYVTVACRVEASRLVGMLRHSAKLK
mmetsp:Transcript_32542/g.82106  ORF Transcript_32542/g.82106 Transcript_32542/m.82106 type:complete len:744 (+) Transcript_32542:156-2387(+)